MGFAIKRALGAAAISSMLSGCAGVMMMGGAGALPLAMMAVGAADGIGMLDGALPSLGGASVNPALRNHPDLTEWGLADEQARMIGRLDAFSERMEARLSAGDAPGCDLSEDTQWRIAHGMTRQAYAEIMAELPADIRPRVVRVEATVLEGRCANGRPEGDFVAVARFETMQGAGNLASTSVERHRVTGRMADDGTFAGTTLRETHRRSVGATLGPISEHTSVSQTVTGDSGLPHMLSVGRILDSDGAVSQISTVITEAPRNGVQRSATYAGPYLMTVSTLRGGQLDGWMTVYPVPFVAGVPAGETTRYCYRAGRQAPEAACAGMAATG